MPTFEDKVESDGEAGVPAPVTIISVIIPVFNEEENVAPLAQEVLNALSRQEHSFEVVFVDDASSDRTVEFLRKIATADARIRYFRHARNSGQSAALWTGIVNSTSPVLATLDGDRQNDPSDLNRLLVRLSEADMVCGNRVERQDSWLRKLSSRVAFLARRQILGAGFQDTGCALRVFRRTAMEDIFPFNGLHRFLPILVQRAGGRVLEVPVKHRPRVAGVSKYGVWNRIWRGIYDLVGVAWYLNRRILRPRLAESSRRKG